MNPLRSYTSATSSRNPTESMPRLHAFPPSPTRYYDSPSSRNLHSPPALSTSTGFERFSTPLARSMHAPPASSASTSFDISRLPTRREGRHFSPPHISPPHSEFHPRLYPGSVRHAARAMAVNRPSYPLGPSVFEPNWRKLMEADYEEDEKTLEEEQQHQSEISTPVAETLVESVHLHSPFQAHSSATSPSLETASSPTSSALAHSPASGLNDVRTSSFFLSLPLSLIGSIMLFSRRLDQPQLPPPTRHLFVVCHIRSPPAGKIPRHRARLIWCLC